MINERIIEIGVIGGLLTTLFGGWSHALTTLVIFMAIDYITGLIVAAIFQRSGKTQNGALSSAIGLKGLVKKVGIILVVLMSHRLDITIGSSFLKDAVVIAFISNESISIIENAGLMGVPIPPILKKAIEVLQKKEKEESEK